jgi:hypothetical protein
MRISARTSGKPTPATGSIAPAATATPSEKAAWESSSVVPGQDSRWCTPFIDLRRSAGSVPDGGQWTTAGGAGGSHRKRNGARNLSWRPEILAAPPGSSQDGGATGWCAECHPNGVSSGSRQPPESPVPASACSHAIRPYSLPVRRAWKRKTRSPSRRSGIAWAAFVYPRWLNGRGGFGCRAGGSFAEWWPDAGIAGRRRTGRRSGSGHHASHNRLNDPSNE